jgi:hypothetical protein
VPHLFIHISKWGGGAGVNFLQCLSLQRVSHVKVRLNDRVAGLTKLDKTSRMSGLLCAILKVMNYGL